MYKPLLRGMASSHVSRCTICCLLNSPACLNYKSILPYSFTLSPAHTHTPHSLINTEHLEAIDIMPLYLYSLVSIFQGQGYFITVIILRKFNINKVFIVLKMLQIVLVIPLSFFLSFLSRDALTRTLPCFSRQAEVAFVVSVPRGHWCRAWAGPCKTLSQVSPFSSDRLCLQWGAWLDQHSLRSIFPVSIASRFPAPEGVSTAQLPVLSLEALPRQCWSNQAACWCWNPSAVTTGENNTTTNSVQKGSCRVTVCPLDSFKLVHIFHR